jgi:hypothetical protein
MLVKTGDAGALCGAMIRMAGDRGASALLGERGRRLCLHRFTADTMVDQIEALYGKLSGTPPAFAAAR